MMKKNYILWGVFSALGGLYCFGDYVVQDFISPRTGQSTVFWADASKGKDAYVLEYDKDTDHYYFKFFLPKVIKVRTKSIFSSKSS